MQHYECAARTTNGRLSNVFRSSASHLNPLRGTGLRTTKLFFLFYEVPAPSNCCRIRPDVYKPLPLAASGGPSPTKDASPKRKRDQFF